MKPLPQRPVPALLSKMIPNASGHEVREFSLVWTVIAVLIVGCSLLAANIYTREGLSTLFASVCGIAAASGVAGYLQWKGHEKQAIRLVVYAMFFGSMLGAFSQGSTRSTAVVGMFGGLIGAGIFLAGGEVITLAAISIGGLGLLNYGELHGWWTAAKMAPGFSPWLVLTLVQVILLIGISIGRSRLETLFHRWESSAAQERHTANRLRASEARARALLQHNPLACIVQDAQSLAVVDINQGFTDLFGYDPELVKNRRPPNLWQDRTDARRFWTALKTQGRVRGMSATGLRLNGSIFDGQVFSEYVTEGEDHLLITMILDVSEQKEALRSLERSRERFSKAFGSCPMGMTIVRISNDKVLEVNEANMAAMGYTRNEVIGQASSKAMNWVHETDRTAFWQTLRNEGRVTGYEAAIWGRSGIQIDASLWASVIDIEGEACALVYTMDITKERRRTAALVNFAKGVSSETGELFFHSLVEQMSKTLRADLALAGEIVDDTTVQSVAVFQDHEQAPDRTYAIEDSPCHHTLRTLNGLYATNNLKDRFPSAYSKDSGGFSSYLGVPLKDVDGVNIGVLNVLWKAPQTFDSDTETMMELFAIRCGAEMIRMRQDRAIVALQETLEQRVAERTEQLEDLNKELDSFAYSVSHDLKTPLRSIEGFMHLLRERTEGRLGPEDLDLMSRVMGASNRMAQLIKDLLALARVSQFPLAREMVDITALARDIIEKLRADDPERIVEAKIASGLRADCDPQLARIALENLMGNAWKYTQKTPEALIELGNLDAATGSPTLFIRDNGAGFDMSRSDRLFKAFQRLHGANEFEGSGIGLATVRRIMDRHGGHIFGEGRVGEGATFKFSFGMADGAWPALSAPAPSAAVDIDRS